MRLTLLLLATALVAPQVAAADTPPAYKAKDLFFTVHVGPNNGTTCKIDATLYKPNDASVSNPAAAILGTNGFGGSKHEFDTLAPSYAKRGYVFLAYSGLGFGGASQDNQSQTGSTCKISLDDPDWDGKAASQLIDFLGGGHAADDGTTVDYVIRDKVDHAGVAQAHDPRLGMIGGSYGGQIQFAAADVDKRLDTIVPQITWNDLSYSLAPNNTSLVRGVSYDDGAPGVEKQEWVSLFFGLGIADGFGDTLSQQDASHFSGMCPNFSDEACQSKAQMDATGYPDKTTIAFARHASVASYMSQIKIPTFLAQGQVDTLFNLNEAVATYNALRAQGTPVKMLWRSSGHSGGDLGNSEDNQGNPEAAYASRAYLAWFDYYLRGVGDPPQLDFSYYRDWVAFPKDQDAAAAVASAPAYPAAPDQTWYLSGAGDLVASAAAVKAGSQQFAVQPGAATSYSETSAVDQSNPPTDGAGTFASFTSPALAKDTDVVGIPKLTFSLTAPVHAGGAQSADPGGMLVLFVKLYDVTPSGDVLPHRLIAPIRVPDAGKPITVTLPGIAHRFAKGDKLKLVIAASDAAYKNNNVADGVTIAVDPAKPFTLTLPVLGGAPPAPVGGAQAPGAGVQSQVKAEGSSNSAARLPRRCGAKRSLRIRLRIPHNRRHDKVLWAKITVNGRHVKTLRGRRLMHPFVLRGLPKHRQFRVVVTERTKRHRVLRAARTYNRGCR